MNRNLRLVVILGSFAASPALGQELGVRSYGLRGGISLNPDQFNFGGHVDVGRLGENIRLQPSVEIGFGNGVTLISANFDAHYRFRPRTLRPYVGGGLGINFIDVNNGVGQPGLDLEPVVNVVGGVEFGAPRPGSKADRRYLLEARVGIGDTPELKLIAGFSF